MITSEILKGLNVEWVKPSRDGNRPGYYRKIPTTRRDPTVRQLEHRLKFSEIAYGTFGDRGVVKTTDNRQIPRNAALIGRELMGTSQPRKALSQRERLMRLLLKR